MNPVTDFEPTKIVPLPFEKPSATRWLVRGKVLYNLLVNWEELKAYFNVIELSKLNIDVRYKATLIKEMLNDHKNYLYIQFATPFVQDFEKVNSFFQQSKADPYDLHQELSLHYRSIRSRIIDCQGNKKKIDQVDFGAKFLLECQKYINKMQSKEANEEVKIVKIRCQSVIEDALDQVSNRLPPGMHVFKDLAKLSPKVVLNQSVRSNFSDLSVLSLAECTNISKIEEQYRKIPFVDWKDEEVFKDGIPTDTEKFWIGVRENSSFKDLADFALTCLVTPVSNAIVERVFSLVASVKTKARNRMQLQLLDSITRIRAEFLISRKCCNEFVPTQQMLDDFVAEKVYSTNQQSTSSGTSQCKTDPDDDIDLFL